MIPLPLGRFSQHWFGASRNLLHMKLQWCDLRTLDRSISSEDKVLVQRGPSNPQCFLLATLRGTMVSADMELMILSRFVLAGATGAPFGMLRLDPDLFLPFHRGLGASVVAGSVLAATAALGGVLVGGGGGLAEVACVDIVEVVSLLPRRSRLLARWPCSSTPARSMLRFPSTPELTTKKS